LKFVTTKNAPAAIGPYSQAVMVKDTLYVSGQLPYIPGVMKLVSESIKDQTLQSLNNILAIAKEAGLNKENIVKCGIFMQDLSMFKEMNEVYANFFGDHKPARFAVEVRRLPLDVLIEIDAIVVK